jgi:hypothetical protein
MTCEFAVPMVDRAGSSQTETGMKKVWRGQTLHRALLKASLGFEGRYRNGLGIGFTMSR